MQCRNFYLSPKPSFPNQKMGGGRIVLLLTSNLDKLRVLIFPHCGCLVAMAMAVAGHGHGWHRGRVQAMAVAVANGSAYGVGVYSATGPGTPMGCESPLADALPSSFLILCFWRQLSVFHQVSI